MQLQNAASGVSTAGPLFTGIPRVPPGYRNET